MTPGDGSSDWQEVDLLTYDEADPRVAEVIAEWRTQVAALERDGFAEDAAALRRRLSALEELHGEIQQALAARGARTPAPGTRRPTS